MNEVLKELKEIKNLLKQLVDLNHSGLLLMINEDEKLRKFFNEGNK